MFTFSTRLEKDWADFGVVGSRSGKKASAGPFVP